MELKTVIFMVHSQFARLSNMKKNPDMAHHMADIDRLIRFFSNLIKDQSYRIQNCSQSGLSSQAESAVFLVSAMEEVIVSIVYSIVPSRKNIKIVSSLPCDYINKKTKSLYPITRSILTTTVYQYPAQIPRRW